MIWENNWRQKETYHHFDFCNRICPVCIIIGSKINIWIFKALALSRLIKRKSIVRVVNWQLATTQSWEISTSVQNESRTFQHEYGKEWRHRQVWNTELTVVTIWFIFKIYTAIVWLIYILIEVYWIIGKQGYWTLVTTYDSS